MIKFLYLFYLLLYIFADLWYNKRKQHPFWEKMKKEE